MAGANVETILTIPDAQLHEVINGNGNLKEWGPLHVTLHGHQGESGLWLKIGKTEWSLTPSTPVLEATKNSYMFAMTDGRFYSVLLANGTAAEEAATLQEILVESTSFEHAGAMTKQGKEEMIAQVAQDLESDPEIPMASTSQQSQAPTTADRITAGALTAQEKLLQGANWASRKILEQTQSYMDKHEATQDPVKISPATARTIKMARRAAEMGNKAANRVAGGLADITIKVSETIIHSLAPKHTGQQLQDPNSRSKAAKEIAAASVLAATGIYDSMTQASQLVFQSSGEAASGYVGHRYGKAAGEVANDAASGTITAGMTYLTVQKVGLKRVARKIAKRAATGLAKQAVLGPEGQQGAQQTTAAGIQSKPSFKQQQQGVQKPGYTQQQLPQQGYNQQQMPQQGYNHQQLPQQGHTQQQMPQQGHTQQQMPHQGYTQQQGGTQQGYNQPAKAYK